MRLCVCLAAVLYVGVAEAGDDVWPGWRGPSGQGTANVTGLPVRWSESRGLIWKLPLPGRGNSSPVIQDRKVWLTTAVDVPSSKERAKERRAASTNSMPLRVSDFVSLRAVCVDLDSGKLLHNVELMTQRDPQMVHIDNTYATPSPIIEGDRLYCHYGPPGFACLDTRTRKVVWENRDLVVAHENGPGSSPVLWGDLLIVHCDGIDQQYIIALDKNTGEPVWKTKRSGSLNANPQLRKAYATPLVVELNGIPQVISPAADWLYGYHAATGEELWRLNYGELGFSNSARPVYGNGLIYTCTGYMKSKLLAVRVNQSHQPEVVWEYTRQVPNVASPLLVDDLLYFASDKGIASCVDALSGEMVWTQRIGARFWPSPLYADGRLYFFDRNGSTVVMEPGREAKVLSKNQLDGQFFATAAVIDGAMVLRTDKALYRVGKEQ